MGFVFLSNKPKIISQFDIFLDSTCGLSQIFSPQPDNNMDFFGLLWPGINKEL